MLDDQGAVDGEGMVLFCMAWIIIMLNEKSARYLLPYVANSQFYPSFCSEDCRDSDQLSRRFCTRPLAVSRRLIPPNNQSLPCLP